MTTAHGHTHIVTAGGIALCGAKVSQVRYLRRLPPCGWCAIAAKRQHLAASARARLNNPKNPTPEFSARRPRLVPRRDPQAA